MIIIGLYSAWVNDVDNFTAIYSDNRKRQDDKIITLKTLILYLIFSSKHKIFIMIKWIIFSLL